MRFLALALIVAFAAACQTGTEHVNAYTGEVCTPNGSYMKKAKKHTNDKCQGTSNGDNCDDLSSGKIDCIGDGNSGQGDDKKHNCMFPQPGCDDQGCCDEDQVDDGGGDDGDTDGDNPDGDNPDGDNPDGDGGGGGGTGGTDGGGGTGGGGGVDTDGGGGGPGGGTGELTPTTVPLTPSSPGPLT